MNYRKLGAKSRKKRGERGYGGDRMKKYLTEKDIRKIFTDPNSLRKGIELWKTAEKKGEEFIRKIKNERKKSLERASL